MTNYPDNVATLGGVVTRIIPMPDRILVEPIESDTKTPGGLVLPDVARERSSQGRVVTVGKNLQDLINRGDILRFEKFAGTDLKIDGKQYKLLRDHEILCIERDSKESV